MLGGHVKLGMSSLTTVAQYLSNGKLKAYGMAAPERAQSAPDVKTFKEQGLGDVDGTIVYTLIATPGTPQPIVAKLNAALNAAVATPQMREDLRSRGFVAMGGTPQELAKWTARTGAGLGPRAAGRRCQAGVATLLLRQCLIGVARFAGRTCFGGARGRRPALRRSTPAFETVQPMAFAQPPSLLAKALRPRSSAVGALRHRPSRSVKRSSSSRCRSVPSRTTTRQGEIGAQRLLGIRHAAKAVGHGFAERWASPRSRDWRRRCVRRLSA